MADNENWADEIMYLSVYGMIGASAIVITRDWKIGTVAVFMSLAMTPYAAYHTVRFLLRPVRWFSRRVKRYRLGGTTVTKK